MKILKIIILTYLSEFISSQQNNSPGRAEICNRFKRPNNNRNVQYTFGVIEQECSTRLNYTNYITPNYNILIHALDFIGRIPRRRENVRENMNLDYYQSTRNYNQGDKLLKTVQYDSVKNSEQNLLKAIWDDYTLFLEEGTEACDYQNKRLFLCMVLFPECLYTQNLPTETIQKYPNLQFESKIYPISPCREMCLLMQQQCVSSINFLEFVTGLKPDPYLVCDQLPPFKKMSETSPQYKELCRLGPDTGLIPDFDFSTVFPTFEVTTFENILPVRTTAVSTTARIETTQAATTRSTTKATEPPTPKPTPRSTPTPTTPKPTIDPRTRLPSLPRESCLIYEVCPKTCPDCTVNYCNNFGQLNVNSKSSIDHSDPKFNPPENVIVSKYLSKLKQKSNFHFKTCDWIIRFMQWRETTFKDWLITYNNYFRKMKRTRALIENENPNVIVFEPKFNKQLVAANENCNSYKKSRPDRHPCRNSNKVVYVSEAFNCDYYFCDITWQESYYDLFNYWKDDTNYFQFYLHENWDSVFSKKYENAKINSPLKFIGRPANASLVRTEL